MLKNENYLITANNIASNKWKKEERKERLIKGAKNGATIVGMLGAIGLLVAHNIGIDRAAEANAKINTMILPDCSKSPTLVYEREFKDVHERDRFELTWNGKKHEIEIINMTPVLQVQDEAFYLQTGTDVTIFSPDKVGKLKLRLGNFSGEVKDFPNVQTQLTCG